MASRADQYRHLGNDPKDGVLIGVESVAAQIDALNYGAHRFLSAIIRLRRASHQTDDLADGLEALLNKGCF